MSFFEFAKYTETYFVTFDSFVADCAGYGVLGIFDSSASKRWYKTELSTTYLLALELGQGMVLIYHRNVLKDSPLEGIRWISTSLSCFVFSFDIWPLRVDTKKHTSRN